MRANLKDGACGKLRSAVRRASNQADQIALEHDPDYVAEPDTRTAAEKKAAREQRQQTAFEKVYGDPNQASSTLDPAPEDMQETSTSSTTPAWYIGPA